MIDNTLKISAKEVFTGRLAAPRKNAFRVIALIAISEPLREDLIEDSVFYPFWNSV
ncbi:hypothetical protein D1872_207370 [compost metagenome]